MNPITMITKATEATKVYLDTQIDSVKSMFVPLETKVSELEEQLKNLPTPTDGKDGLDGLPGKDGIDGSTPSIEHLEKALEEAISSIKHGVDGKDGLDGLPGKDGETPSIEHLEEMATELLENTKKAIEDVISNVSDGVDGKDGKDGETPSIEHLEKKVSDSIVNLEKQIAEVISNVSDGVDGKDGKDGETPSIEHLEKKVSDSIVYLETQIAEVTQGSTETISKALEPIEPTLDLVSKTLEINSSKLSEGLDLIDSTLGELKEKTTQAVSYVIEDAYNNLEEMTKSLNEAIANVKDGKDGETPSIEHLENTISDLVSQTKSTISEVIESIVIPKDGKDGLPGAPGQDGAPGRDADIEPLVKTIDTFIVNTKTLVDEAISSVAISEDIYAEKFASLNADINKVIGTRIDSLKEVSIVKSFNADEVTPIGTIVEHDGDLFVTLKATTQIPGESNHYSRILHKATHHGAYKNELNILKGDSVMSARGSMFIANVDNPTAGPDSQNTEAGQWKLAVRSVKGEKGDSGVQGLMGEKGDDAPFIQSMQYQMVEDQLLVKMSDGTEQLIQIPMSEMVEKAIMLAMPDYETPINEYRGNWHANISYKRGAIVTYSNAIYIAREDSTNVAPVEPLSPTRQVASNRAWQLFLMLPPIFDASILNNAITSVATLTRDVQALTSGVSHETQVFDVLPAPPATPAEGDAYLVAATGATGAFAGKANNVAFYENGAWVFTPPAKVGETHHVELQNVNLTWNGTKYVKTASGVTSTVSPTAPNGPKDGDFWLDTSVQPSNLKSYSATLNGWVNVTNGTRTVTSVNDPAATMGPKNGDIWVKPATTSPVAPAETKSWLNGAWVLGTPTIPVSSRTYVQVAAPVGATDGDLWIQHITGQKDVYYHFIAGGWTNDAGTRTFVQDADPAAAAVEGDIWTNVTAPVATKVRHNGAWVAPAAAPTIPSGTPVITVGAGVTAARSTRGDQYYDTNTGQFFVYDGTNWVQPGPKFLQITQASYTALATKDSNTLYIIVG